MQLFVTKERKIFLSFFLFGLINNILYVVILSAAIDIVGIAIPKAVVLLADILPSLSIKVLAPFFLHKVPYSNRIWILLTFSFIGMIMISLSQQNQIVMKLIGISMASFSSGMGEVSFLLLTHFYDEKIAIGAFSMGTGGAGIVGSFLFLLLTNIFGTLSWSALLFFAIIPFGFPVIFYALLPTGEVRHNYSTIIGNTATGTTSYEDDVSADPITEVPRNRTETDIQLITHVFRTLQSMKHLIRPFMIPLCTVYIAEYTINQGVSPTLLFPLDDIPKWLFLSYRDIYVFYGFLYQLGVFISRSSLTLGLRFRNLHLLSFLQMSNLFLALVQAKYDFPFPNIWLLMCLIFYEGLLGGCLYVNTFLSVSEQVDKEEREFSLACVGISDSLGVMIAGFISLWLEGYLCESQVERGRSYCRDGSQ